MAYTRRIVDVELDQLLNSAGAVLIEGPKACGKTSTALQLASTSVRLDIDVNAPQAAEIDPALVLAGATPRLLDEWQMVPALGNAVRAAVDDRSLDGQFISARTGLREDLGDRNKSIR